MISLARKQLFGLAGATALLASGGFAGFAIARSEAAPAPPPLSVHQKYEQPGFAALVATVKPAVVNISTEHVPALKPASGNDPEFNDFLRQFLGPNAGQMFQQAQRPTHALGSGFIVDPDGYVVTNNHVIDDASDIEVTLTDGSVHKAHIVGRDTKTDLALLKIDVGRPLPYVAFGDSDKADVGDWVVAVGNPYGLGGSVSAGIISGEKRNINEGPYDSFLQVDAPINPGNSGGPLFDQSGKVIGIDTAIYTPSGGSVGIGFAIPSNVAARVVDQLRAHGHVDRGWLGIQMQALTPALASAVGLHNTNGVLVDMVTRSSPASHAGLAQGDVITAFNGKPVDSTRDLAFDVADVHSGTSVSLTVLRNGHDREISVTIGTQSPGQLASAAPQSDQSPVGLGLAPLTDEQRGNGIENGAVVANVAPGSPADLSGIQPGDIILSAGQQKVNSPQDAAADIHAAQKSHRSDIALLVERGGVKQYIAIDLTGHQG